MKWCHKELRTFAVYLITGFLITVLGTNVCAQNKEIKDSDITSAIETDLLFDNSVSSHLIDVKTNEGIVTLSGSVNNLLARERALKIAGSIKGVRSVVNLIEVKPVVRTDSEIKDDVENALLLDPATALYKVDVNVDNGVVTLTGEVHSWAEKQLSAQVAKGVRGITDIKNNIKIVYKTSRSDFEIKPEIEKRLEADPYVDERLIDVDVKNGNVELNGTVGSVREKNNASINAWVAGVSSVDTSDLEIKWWAKDKMKQKTVSEISDKQIEKSVKDTFLYDPRVYSFKIDVDSDYGLVTLSGVVDNYKAKRVAEQDARNVKGVIAVYNNIKVRPEKETSDEEIAERIRRVINWDPVLEGYEISTLVRNKKAYLYGDVDSFYEKERSYN